MFAYCRNNPVRRVDISGTADADCLDEDGRPLSNEDILNLSKGGGGTTAGNSVTSGGGFRTSLQKLTGQSGEGSHAHHVFPRKFSSQFKSIGIDNQKPQYGAWWEKSAHLKNSYEYNLWWKSFFKSNGVTKEDAYELAKFLAELFGYDLNL